MADPRLVIFIGFFKKTRYNSLCHWRLEYVDGTNPHDKDLYMLFYTYDKWSSIHSTIAVGKKTYDVEPLNEMGQEMDIGIIMGMRLLEELVKDGLHFAFKKKLSMIPQDVLNAIGKL